MLAPISLPYSPRRDSASWHNAQRWPKREMPYMVPSPLQAVVYATTLSTARFHLALL